MTQNNGDTTEKIFNYKDYGIVQNSDGTFSIKNNPFGKFSKTTIEDYINKYLLPETTKEWINGYSQIYSVNDTKMFLIKTTLKGGVRAFKGAYREYGVMYNIYFAVDENGKPDGKNVLRKIKV